MIINRLFRQYKWITIFAVCLSLVGCLTAPQVRTIVEESNAKLLDMALTQSRLLALDRDSEAIAAGISDSKEFDKLINRIHEFIENNQDVPKTINPLRIRLGVLYMLNGKPVLAKTAFESAEAVHLVNERDKFLKEHSDDLIWWYAEEKGQLRTEAGKKRGVEFLNKVSAKELRSTELRAFFEQVRANVAAEVVGQINLTDDPEKFRPVINGVISSYTEHWDPNHREDIKYIRKSMKQSCVTADFKTNFFLEPEKAATIEKMVADNGVEIFKMYPTVFCTVETIQKRWSIVSREPLKTPVWIKCTVIGDNSIVCDGN